MRTEKRKQAIDSLCMVVIATGLLFVRRHRYFRDQSAFVVSLPLVLSVILTVYRAHPCCVPWFRLR